MWETAIDQKLRVRAHIEILVGAKAFARTLAIGPIGHAGDIAILGDCQRAVLEIIGD